MKSTFSIVYATSIHILLAQSMTCSAYLVYREHYHTHYASIPRTVIARNDTVPRYDVQTYNELLDQAKREIAAKGGR